MTTILSHTFNFHSRTNKKNILSITEEDAKKHFIQYIQYQILDEDSIALRYVNIKVDRGYYLEVANICINPKERRRQLFAILGKRRFGANSHRVDYYLFKDLDKTLLHQKYIKNYEARIFEASYTEESAYSINEYRFCILEVENSNIVFLDQKNVTKRKKQHKTFCVELYDDEVKILKNLSSEKKKINYIFNKIGKIHFKSLETQTLKLSTQDRDLDALAHSKLTKSSTEMESSSRLHDNLVFRKLQEILEENGRVDLEVHKACTNMLHNPEDNTSLADFTQSLNKYIALTTEIRPLEDMLSHFSDISNMLSSGSLNYLFQKNDSDLKDIFLYMLESFSDWNKHLVKEDEDVRTFNIATIDFNDALRHLVNTCLKFTHEYKCHDVEILKEGVEVQKILTEYNTEEKVTSAQEYFTDVTLDMEVYDELLELEDNIELLLCSEKFTIDINHTLIIFFEGYTRALNPLFEFKDLSYSLMLLGKKLSAYELDDNSQMLLVLLQAFISDLLEWKRTVLVEQTAENIHYMDKSFYSNIAQIEISLVPQEDVDFDDEIEFF